MILREFLYVDTDKVRSLLAQIGGGIYESETKTFRRAKRLNLGGKYLNLGKDSGDDLQLTKSLADALFPLLEQAMTDRGALRDLSSELRDRSFWSSQDADNLLKLGSLVRIKAKGFLFDSRYIAEIFSSFAWASHGFADIALQQANSRLARGRKSPRVKRNPNQLDQLEDLIPDIGNVMVGGSPISSNMLKSMVRVLRGLYPPGLNLNLSPIDEDSLTINVRLQEGRQYLDSDREILFARYGTEPQEWVLVGNIGARGTPECLGPEPEIGDHLDEINRSEFSRFVNHFVGKFGKSGVVDTPRYPSFSIVPLAVYREIPNVSPPPRENFWRRTWAWAQSVRKIF